MTDPIPLHPNLWLLHGKEPPVTKRVTPLGLAILAIVAASGITMLALVIWFGLELDKHFIRPAPAAKPPAREAIVPTPVSAPAPAIWVEPSPLQAKTDQIWQEWTAAHQPLARENLGAANRRAAHSFRSGSRKRLGSRAKAVNEYPLAPEAMKCPPSVCFP